MESDSEKTEDCFLKIDTIWSQADENVVIKEEIFSDLESDSINCVQDNSNDCTDQTDPLVKDEKNGNEYLHTSPLPVWQPVKKNLKGKNQKNEEAETLLKYKLSCMHDTKNFKIIKRRLRCGDCRSLVCPECCKVMIPNLQSHFLGSGLCSSGTYFCKSCSIIFHSLCALQAHIRIHTMETPYVCPDCGLIYNNIYFLILHLLNKCYHVYKVVRYKCKQCPGAYFTSDTFVQHIQQKHIHCVFRCLYCSSLFNNYDEFNCHMENLHHKHKVQYLNYFQCSLCSNIVIPKFMYQRHVSQHRENSEFYEVDYQCVCGDIYNLIGAFRSHFSYCSKKGILPPKWSFLQKKLRTYDVVCGNLQTEEPFIQPSVDYLRNDTNYQNLSLAKPNDKIIIRDKDNTSDDSFPKKSNCNEAVKDTNSEIIGNDFFKTPYESFSEESNTNCDSVKNLGDPVSNEKAQGEKSPCGNPDQPEVTIINEVVNTQLGDKCSKNVANKSIAFENSNQTEEQQKSKSKEPSEQTDGDISKIYDHIPCDHLGYLIKKQCSEQYKGPTQDNNIIVEKSFSPKSYKIVTLLDEKTGIITTKAVSVEELEIEKENENENINKDDFDMESSNFSSTAKQYCNDKSKLKFGNSLSCPFCIVLFPKHNLTFQQFRLHLESYHPDAALNININKVENKAPDKLNSGGPENKIEGCKNSNGDDENSQPSSNICEKETNPKEKQNESQNSSLVKPIKPKIISDGSNDTVSQKEYERKESGEAGKTVCQPEEVSSVQSQKLKECKVETERTYVDINSSVEEIEKQENTRTSGKEDPNLTEKRSDFERSVEKTESNKTETVEEVLEKPNFEPRDKIPSKSISDSDFEGETSKDSNWSGFSEKDSKSVSPTELKAEEKDRSRRESEVWSEFYESLMLAEKLKKRKNLSPEPNSKKKSVVSDYSSKRIVKKPKRYRESSESDDSNEISGSDEDFLLENEFTDKICSEEKGVVEEQLNKKQILVNKLESVDGKFVDYLFNLVTKREKLFELFKKHSALRTNRYSHTLRSYRQNVLNGIKQRGRPIKILRYRELLKKKNLIRERDIKENFQPKKKSEFLSEHKINEKKRGRPRKAHDPAKLKDRRRSDKEVDFIEKNFEREESDMSPSKRKRKLSSKLQYYKKMSDEKDDFSSGQVICNKPTDSNKKFTCAVCKVVLPEQTEFREHIVTHRMEENTYQCMECGECFVVRPSLEKHLHAFHKIKNTDKYIMDNECCNIKKDVMEEDNEPLKENQCKVCKDQFDRQIDLTKHFRIHGMAFLKEFRRDGKLNKNVNPNKKAEF